MHVSVLVQCTEVSRFWEAVVGVCEDFFWFVVLNCRLLRFRVDILWQSAHQEPAIIRNYMMCDEEWARDHQFLRNVTTAVVQDPDDSIKGQMVDVLKLLLEGNTEWGRVCAVCLHAQSASTRKFVCVVSGMH